MHTEKAGIRTLFPSIFGIIFLISGVVGLLGSFNVQTFYSFGTLISVVSIIAGVYFILSTHISRKNRVKWSTK
ncbi:membrane protein [Cuniculiplasma divulgatum]|uniref:Membrane protein n=1 Tax=Cuniculiplasma divulgatum TaxID=1673428 RepID=A0A1N5WGE2_9ARCH|nr:membrane protein [Cuniculiplasma divulgatum]